MRKVFIWGIIALFAVITVWLLTNPSKSAAADMAPVDHSYDDPKLVWGGGPVAVSSYSGKIVPEVVRQLEKNLLGGYHWGGPSQGTAMNAARVTFNPTHLALGQADILSRLNGTQIPGTDMTYNFTVLQTDIGDECLYMVTKNPYYKTWGNVLENAWDISIATGGELSGSFGTLQSLMEIYPKLRDALVEHAGGTGDIVQSVVDGKTTFGFFVMRPDPNNDVFEAIADNELALVPVVDFDLEDKYRFQSLKIAASGFFGTGEGIYHETACTQIQVITGNPQMLTDDQSRYKRRLEATIKRVSTIDGPAFKQAVVGQFTTWHDYLSSVRDIGSERLQELLDASKDALDRAVKN